MFKQPVVVALAAVFCVGCQTDLPTELHRSDDGVAKTIVQTNEVTSTLGLQELWAQQVGDGSFYVDPWWTRAGNKGETYVMGLTNGPIHGVARVAPDEYADCFLSKYDAGGARLWTVMLTRPGSFGCINPDFGVLTNGTIRAVVNNILQMTSNEMPFDVIDISDADGSVIRTFPNVGAGFASVSAFVDQSGAITTQGTSWQGGVPNPNGTEVRRYRSNLSLSWTAALGEYEAWGITVHPSTSWVVAPTQGGGGVKVFDANGNLQKECSLPAHHFAWYYAFAPDHPTAVYVSNYEQLDFKPWLAKLDWSTCAILWEGAPPEIPSYGQGADVQIDGDGNVWQVGYYRSANGTDDVFFRAFTPDGDLIGEQFWGTETFMESLWSFAFDKSGAISLFSGYLYDPQPPSGEAASDANASLTLRSMSRGALLSPLGGRPFAAGESSSAEAVSGAKTAIVQKLSVPGGKSKGKGKKSGKSKDNG
jgi:hypothetical protein